MPAASVLTALLMISMTGAALGQNRIANQNTPKRLDPTELAPVTGRISWPLLLRDDRFRSARARLE